MKQRLVTSAVPNDRPHHWHLVEVFDQVVSNNASGYLSSMNAQSALGSDSLVSALSDMFKHIRAWRQRYQSSYLYLDAMYIHPQWAFQTYLLLEPKRGKRDFLSIGVFPCNEEYPARNLRCKYAYIPQEIERFHGTVVCNVLDMYEVIKI